MLSTGYNTYVLSTVSILLAAAHVVGWIDQQSLVTILAILVPAAQATTRMAIGNVETETAQVKAKQIEVQQAVHLVALKHP